MIADPDRDLAVHEIRGDISGIRNFLKGLLAVVFVALMVMSVTGIIAARVSSTTQDVSKQNRAFLQNFDDYMRCLVVTEPEAVKTYGLENYYNLCDDLLFRNTGLVPLHTKVTIPATQPQQ